MRVDVYLRLSGMMLLQYAVWGAWLPVASRYLGASGAEGGLGFTGSQIGWILGLGGSVGAVCAPFVAGQLADRRFSTERVLACLLLLGGVLKWITAAQTTFAAWLGLSIVYSILYMPTLALTNSLAFAHLKDGKREFPWVRVWGTLGWIAASWAFPMLFLQSNLHWQWMPPFVVGTEHSDVVARLAHALRFSGAMSILYASFCLRLPHTPPRRDAVEKLAIARAARLFARPSFCLLVVVSLAIAAIHQIYFLQTFPFLKSIGLLDSEAGPAMTVGQFAEILILPALGFLLAKLGFRWVITLGAAAYFARYVVFATPGLPPWLIVASQAFHGLCYSCFFAASYIYVDRLAPSDVRHTAQTLFGILILGGGPIFGGILSGRLQAWCTVNDVTPAVVNYSPLWYVLAGIGLACALLIAVLFRDETGAAASKEEA
ncbi:MAG: MFS transporter [Phycisphaerales bacterium]|nr:MFS transporter [Phycisphaerales bacterium]